jgi:NTE family protein
VSAEAGTPEPLGRRGIGLCLSGGGFRATLFHLGALRRLNELGLLIHPDFRTVASVSGGAIAAAALATAFARLQPSRVLPPDVWEREVHAPLRAFTRRDQRTRAFLERLLPWNLWRPETTVAALASRYEKELTPLRLTELPARPEFLFLATDMAWGVAWLFSRERVGDYQVGYRPPGDLRLGQAVAASACFPPLMGPMRLHLDAESWSGGAAPRDQEWRHCVSDLRLTDGGVYDNMGLEPVWKDHAVVLVSDAGGLFTAEADKGLLWRVPRYQAIQEQQARALRKRWFIAALRQRTLAGTYWSVGSASSSYGEARPGYSKALARDVVARIRTDLDAFSDAEAAVLVNHGYTVADAALCAHMPHLLPASAPPAMLPHPEWFPPARSEGEIREALAGSSMRKTFGRDGDARLRTDT